MEIMLTNLKPMPLMSHNSAAVAVIFGVLGCIALVMKRRLAIPLLIISLLGVLAQNTHMYLLSDAAGIMGVGASPFVIAGAITLVPFAIFCAHKSWLRRLEFTTLK